MVPPERSWVIAKTGPVSCRKRPGMVFATSWWHLGFLVRRTVMTRRSCFGSFSALGLFALCALPLAAQAPVRDDSFGEEIQVNVVNLDVFVSDKQGKPVAGLQAGDFTVTEDGKPVKITNFYTEKRGSASPAAAGGA